MPTYGSRLNSGQINYMLNNMSDINAIISTDSRPQLPFDLQLEQNNYQCVQILRDLPERRLVMKAIDSHGKNVVIKLFASQAKAQKDFERELQGVDAVKAVTVKTPKLLFSVSEPHGSALVYDFIENSQTFHLDSAVTERLALLSELMHTLHLSGIYQDDIHLDNLLLSGDEIVLIDLGSVKQSSDGKALDKDTSLTNLARLFAQFSLQQRSHLMPLLKAYYEGRGWHYSADEQQQFTLLLEKTWQQRKTQFLKKCFRPCTMTYYQKNVHWQVAAKRDFWQHSQLQSIRDIETLFAGAQVLKAGNTATVVRTKLAGREVVIKRYNIKNLGHAVSRCWRPSRAAASWRNANLLVFSGIPTTEPLAFIEKRFGPLRQTAYFISEYHEAEELLDVYQQRMPTESEVSQIQTIFSDLKTMQVGHGDMKAQNLLLDKQGKIRLIDLDAMREYSNKKQAIMAHLQDKKRFLKNWKNPELEAFFRVMLQGQKTRL